VSRVPYNRWDLAFATELAAEQQTSFGSFVPGVDGFDAAAFGLPEAEAVLLDPQQRLLMEVAWELLAGTAAAGSSSSSAADAAAYRAGCGVFVGVSSRDYFTLGKQYSQVRPRHTWQYTHRSCMAC
jgi:acyl transferase domain-containing protein